MLKKRFGVLEQARLKPVCSDIVSNRIYYTFLKVNNKGTDQIAWIRIQLLFASTASGVLSTMLEKDSAKLNGRLLTLTI